MRIQREKERKRKGKQKDIWRNIKNSIKEQATED